MKSKKDLQKAIASAATEFLKENPLITDGQSFEKLHAMFLHGALSNEAKEFHLWNSIKPFIELAADEYRTSLNKSGLSDLSLTAIKHAYALGARSDAAQKYHQDLNKEISTYKAKSIKNDSVLTHVRIDSKSKYVGLVHYEIVPNKLWQGKTLESKQSMIENNGIWIKPATRYHKENGYEYDNSHHVWIPIHRIYDYTPVEVN
jgi:hypothetical protein